MNAPESIFALPDVQASADSRQLPIQHVGVRGLRYPLRILADDGREVGTVATVSVGVGLPAHVKGTHMSRFVELLESNPGPVGVASLRGLLDRMLARLEATTGRIELAFPYFIRKSAPVSGVESLLDYDVTLISERLDDGSTTTTLRLVAPVTSLCPCSKEISAYGAHNQRSLITLEVGLRSAMAIEELARLAEEEASCEVFGLLKRTDEKWVTERAYDNPKFVEDLVRDIALRLMQEARISTWKVASENFESIHNHSAYAELHGCNA